jgi:hypothetical protein
MPPVTTTPPPDDSGSDAFARFGYQAHVAFPFCLRCYFADDLDDAEAVAAIYCEHWEDLLVEYDDRLRFVPIKTRDASRGPWKFRHLLDDGGALRSLLRTHRALAELSEERAIDYDIRLEGAVDSGDAIRRLLVGGGGADDGMCDQCADRLGIDRAEAETLLARVTVRPNQAPRGLIEAQNRELLRTVAGDLSANELKDIYDETIEIVKQAMVADLLADAWPMAIVEPTSAAEAAVRRAERKRLDRDVLRPALAKLEGGDHRLLVAVTDPDRLEATALEKKLVAAGASENLVDRAKQFRALAAIRVAEERGRSLFDVDALLADLHLRLLNEAESVAEIVDTPAPAPAVWDELGRRLGSNPTLYDPRGLLRRDQLLLLGEVCQLSDECKYRWGIRA